jgi:hypothetical protein
MKQKKLKKRKTKKRRMNGKIRDMFMCFIMIGMFCMCKQQRTTWLALLHCGRAWYFEYYNHSYSTASRPLYCLDRVSPIGTGLLRSGHTVERDTCSIYRLFSLLMDSSSLSI